MQCASKAHRSLLLKRILYALARAGRSACVPQRGQHARTLVAGCSTRLRSRAAGAADTVEHQPGPARAGARGGERQLERPRRMDREAYVVRAVAPVAHLRGVRGACGRRRRRESACTRRQATWCSGMCTTTRSGRDRAPTTRLAEVTPGAGAWLHACAAAPWHTCSELARTNAMRLWASYPTLLY
jgi:hypothetical protein